MKRHSRWLGSLLLSTTLAGTGALGGAGLLTACGPEETVGPLEENPLASGADFVAIPRHTGAEARAKRAKARDDRALPPASTEEDFYLAIKKSALKDKWFLSAYISQYFPGGVAYGAANSLGIKVVSFRIQNDKLYVFDAGDGKASSSVFDPEILVEAYPIADDGGFGSLPGSSQYVLVDPAAGLNRFGVVSDWFAPGNYPGYTPVPFQIDLSFLQRFRQLADGASFEQVFTGYADTQINGGPLETNGFQLSGTLNIALRKYAEGAGFQQVPAPATTHYFLNAPKLDPVNGSASQLASHWNIHPGMQPIKWLISPELAKYQAQHPELGGADIVAAVKNAIESWNQAFGFTVFTAQVAPPGAQFGDDDKNFIIFDPSPEQGYAYANWRANPNSGEIRGADVYFGAAWLDPEYYTDDPPSDDNAPKAPPQVASITWGGLGGAPLCAQHVSDGKGFHALPGATQLTGKQKFELAIQHMVVHEIGHTLGLRHNFEGSLLPPSSSVMDYLFDEEGIVTPVPQAYDVDAVKYLYGLSAELPTQPFCTDENTAYDPLCARFDRGADPLNEFWAPEYTFIEGYAFDYGFFNDFYFDYYSQGLLAYVRGGDAASAAAAWDVVDARIRPPVDAAVAADPTQAAAVDFVSRTVIDKLYGAGSSYATITFEPSDPYVVTSVITDLGGVLRNVDGIRSFEARRQAVDVLKKLQRVDAYQALLDARATLEAALADGSLAGTELALTTDLLARLDAAIRPYFI